MVILQKTTSQLTSGMSPRISRDDWLSRYAVLDERVAVIEALRGADPTKAAKALVVSHQKLLAAVNDPRGDLLALQEAISDFVEKAKQVREAFTKLSSM